MSLNVYITYDILLIDSLTFLSDAFHALGMSSDTIHILHSPPFQEMISQIQMYVALGEEYLASRVKAKTI